MDKDKKGLVSKQNMIPFIIVLAIVVIGALLAVYLVFFNNKNINKGYRAYFLDNNEVYFGLEEKRDDGYIKIKDVYYLQVSQITTKDSKGQDVQQPDFKIIKMGTEIHGPKNEMEIVKEHVLFIQELADTSKVLQVIEKYNQAGQVPQLPAPQTQQPATNK
jgi:hypothetical protein